MKEKDSYTIQKGLDDAFFAFIYCEAIIGLVLTVVSFVLLHQYTCLEWSKMIDFRLIGCAFAAGCIFAIPLSYIVYKLVYYAKTKHCKARPKL